MSFLIFPWSLTWRKRHNSILYRGGFFVCSQNVSIGFKNPRPRTSFYSWIDQELVWDLTQCLKLCSFSLPLVRIGGFSFFTVQLRFEFSGLHFFTIKYFSSFWMFLISLGNCGYWDFFLYIKISFELNFNFVMHGGTWWPLIVSNKLVFSTFVFFAHGFCLPDKPVHFSARQYQLVVEWILKEGGF